MRSSCQINKMLLYRSNFFIMSSNQFGTEKFARNLVFVLSELVLIVIEEIDIESTAVSCLKASLRMFWSPCMSDHAHPYMMPAELKRSE